MQWYVLQCIAQWYDCTMQCNGQCQRTSTISLLLTPTKNQTPLQLYLIQMTEQVMQWIAMKQNKIFAISDQSDDSNSRGWRKSDSVRIFCALNSIICDTPQSCYRIKLAHTSDTMIWCSVIYKKKWQYAIFNTEGIEVIQSYSSILKYLSSYAAVDKKTQERMVSSWMIQMTEWMQVIQLWMEQIGGWLHSLHCNHMSGFEWIQ